MSYRPVESQYFKDKIKIITKSHRNGQSGRMSPRESRFERSAAALRQSAQRAVELYKELRTSRREYSDRQKVNSDVFRSIDASKSSHAERNASNDLRAQIKLAKQRFNTYESGLDSWGLQEQRVGFNRSSVEPKMK
jgi:hypothetical protein